VWSPPPGSEPDPTWGPPSSPQQARWSAQPAGMSSGTGGHAAESPATGWAHPQGWARPTGGFWDRIFGAPIDSSTKTGELPPSYFWQSLVCLILFPVTGAVALGYSVAASHRAGRGDSDGSIRASRLSRIWCFASLAGFALLALVLLLTVTR
jgi:Interferon-induced transmembrane protein